MYTGRVYRTIEMVLWTRFETLSFFFIISIWVLIYQLLGLNWFSIPSTPLALIGTAVAFVIGFQNNAVYGRLWEARKIWGGIVNTSRTFGVFTQAMLSDEHSHQEVSEEKIQQEVKTLTHRHIAWMTALRHAMRQQKPWETAINHKTNQEWGIRPPEKLSSLEEDLKPYISKNDLAYIMSKNNKQTALLYLQSHHLKQLKDQGIVWEFSFLELEAIIQELFTLQGKSERIKNFPYPRQYASLNHYFMWLLLLLLPMAIIPHFMDIGNYLTQAHATATEGIGVFWAFIGKYFAWLSVPIYMIVAWIFHTMERIGRTGENPFEGTSNDVPISTIARGIEIDLRQNLGENVEDIPAQFEEKFKVQF